MSAVSYKASVSDQASVSINIDPADKVKARIAAVRSGKDLKNAIITQTNGTTSSLMPHDVSEADCDAAATAIQQLVHVASTLPSDGRPQTSSATNGFSVQSTAQPSQLLNLAMPPHRPDAGISIIDAALVSAKDTVVTGSTPFPDNASTNAIIQAPDFSSLQQIMLGDSTVFKTLTIMSEFAAMAGLGFSVIANDIKMPWMAEGKPHEVSGIIKQVSIPIKLLVLMPGFIQPRSNDDSWETQMDAVVTDLAFMKVLHGIFDKVA
ncbi:hypothetical protein AK830_g2447 [Neonectria ditissima]|uniref:Uncharacterized protein n=1 Tax=Neonectria ditissima TaxID=78410 RepID=A0A0N8H8B0_9HYPO|nr:hypothetical protein AK830_g2447 [Neonectria ditissima]